MEEPLRLPAGEFSIPRVFDGSIGWEEGFNFSRALFIMGEVGDGVPHNRPGVRRRG